MELTRDARIYSNSGYFDVDITDLTNLNKACEQVVLSQLSDGFANFVIPFKDKDSPNNYDLQINNTYNEKGRLLSISYTITDEHYNFIKAYNKELEIPVSREDYNKIFTMVKNIFTKDELPDVNEFDDVTNWAIFDVPVEDKWRFIKSAKALKIQKNLIKEIIPETSEYLKFGINATLLSSILLFLKTTKNNDYKLYKIEDEEDCGYYIELNIPKEFEGLFGDFRKYKLSNSENAVSVSGFSEDNKYFEHDIEDLNDFKTIAPVLFILLARDYLEDSNFEKLFKTFSNDRSFKNFKCIYKYFIKKHKKEHSRYGYWNISAFDPSLDSGKLFTIEL